MTIKLQEFGPTANPPPLRLALHRQAKLRSQSPDQTNKHRFEISIFEQNCGSLTEKLREFGPTADPPPLRLALHRQATHEANTIKQAVRPKTSDTSRGKKKKYGDLVKKS